MDTRRTTSRAARLLAVLAAGVCALRGAPTVVAAPGTTAPVTAVIDASKTSAPINPNLYGMFIEHAGSLVYRGMWAEMLDDRKFCNPIAAESAEPPAGTPPGSLRRPASPMDPRRSSRVRHHGRPACLRRRPLPRDRARLQRASRHPPEGAGPPARQVLCRSHRPRRRSRRPGLGQPRLGNRRQRPPDADDRQADCRLWPVPARLQVPRRQRRRPDRDHRDRSRHPAHRRRLADARGQRERLEARGHRRPQVPSLGRLSLAGRQLRLRPRLARRDRRSGPAPDRSGTPSGAPCSPTTSAPTSS